MRVLVDTCIWSLALRRSSPRFTPDEERSRDSLAQLIDDGRVMMLGPIRQELLTGIRDPASYERLRDRLRAFEDERLVVADYEAAAEVSTACRRAGVSAAAVDALICAVALRRGVELFTTDQDFARFAKVVPLRLHEPADG